MLDELAMVSELPRSCFDVTVIERWPSKSDLGALVEIEAAGLLYVLRYNSCLLLMSSKDIFLLAMVALLRKFGVELLLFLD